MGTHPIFESDFDCLTEVKFPENMDVQLTARDNATMIENAKKTLAGKSSKKSTRKAPFCKYF